MKKILLFMIGIILFCSFSSALISSDLGDFEFNKTVELYQNCENCTFVNISSVKLPNSTIILFNENMIKNAQDYTFLFNETASYGKYFYNVCGDKDGTLNCEDISFRIGKQLSTGESILYTLMIIIFFGLLILMFYLILRLPFKNIRDSNGNIIEIIRSKYIKVILIAFTYPVLLLMLNLLNGLAINFTQLTIFAGIVGFLFSALVSLIYPWMIFIVLWIGYLAIRDSNLKKLIETYQRRIK